MMDEKLSLSELQLLIRDSIYTSLPGFFRIYAEISEAKENSNGHCYIELIEKHHDEINVRARVRAVIWNKRYRFIKSTFESLTGESLREGLKILFRAKVEYHEIYGLSLVITDIDPAYTVGEMALKRRQILLRLEEEGVINMNREIEPASAPRRIAVISSPTSAGYTDFIKHLSGNMHGYVFHSALFEAVMQGPETEDSIISALNRISEYINLFDAVVIIRGGGSQSDLSWFDSYKIAYYITQFPIPVITGIGHEKDFSVTDMVAFLSLKTPTAVADYLIDRMLSAEKLLTDLANDLYSMTAEIIKEKKERISQWMVKLLPITNRVINSERKSLAGLASRAAISGRKMIDQNRGIMSATIRVIETIPGNFLRRMETKISRSEEIMRITSKNTLTSAASNLVSYKEKLEVMDPDNVLKRGYTITYKEGVILKSVSEVSDGNQVVTVFRDGSILSRVESKKRRK